MAIPTHEPMNVEDASRHEVFKDFANVTGQPDIRFYAGVSHDIRTPAAAIVGASQILHRKNLPDAAHRLVEGIESSGKVLTLLLNNLLDLANIGPPCAQP